MQMLRMARPRRQKFFPTARGLRPSLIRANLFSDVNNRSGRMSLPIIRAPAFGNWNQTRDGDVYVANYR
jgi:hypothetical protein